MAKDSPGTKPKKGGNSAFRKFERLAEKIVRVPKNQVAERAGRKKRQSS